MITSNNTAVRNDRFIDVDVALIGVGIGGVAALQALLEKGLRVAAFEEYAWIGGQVSSQALCVLDEFHDPVSEKTGYSRRYHAFRESLRDFYRKNFRLSKGGAAQLYFNPGNAMNSFMVAEPHVAHQVLREKFAPYEESGQLRLFCGWVAASVRRDGHRLLSVTCRNLQKPSETVEARARFFLDGTEAGDLYPLIPVSFRLGADGREAFDEPHAEPEANPQGIQSSTVCFAVEYVPGGDFRIPRPADYDEWEHACGPFRLDAPGASREEPSLMFRRKLGRNGRMVPPAFYYRCVIDRRNFDDPKRPFSRAIINCACNDFALEPMVGGLPTHLVYERAKALSTAYFYWLQNHAPRDDGKGVGYPELRLCPEITGTPDGMAMAPYIREGRRLCACTTILEQDIARANQTGARARHYDDSVGLGGFIIDVHKRCLARSVFSGGVTTNPYQIPLSALVSTELENFAVAGKCIGTTQITNGAYRLHNIEWAIGEAAGELAAFCLSRSGASGFPLTGRALFDYQRELIRQGVPVFWYDDLPLDHPAFEAIQLFSVRRIWPADPSHLRADAQHSVARSLKSVETFFQNLAALGADPGDIPEITLVCHGTRKEDLLVRMLRHLDDNGWPDAAFGDTGTLRTAGASEAGIPEALA
ncbi:hypothetical protein OpiT1DRAFT_00909 [Opitutaceae bacterium TAV1]|nr:hypothetical protein OpiT1DRAFT_00909 [Opitutaceae bacterium TAV1]